MTQSKQDCYNTESLDLVPQDELPEENDIIGEDASSDTEDDQL